MKKGGFLKLVILLWTAMILAGCAGSGSSVEKRDRELSEEEKTQARQYFVEGSLLEMQGEYEKAIDEYRKALALDENAAIFYALSKSYLELGQLAKAAETGREAVRRDGEKLSYRENLASVYIRAREIDKAIEQYEKMVELDPNNSQSFYTLARLYQFERPLKSLELYNTMLGRFGEQLEILAQIVDLNNSLGRHDEAAEAIERMLDLDPGNESLMLTLGSTYLQAEKFEQAKEIFLELFEIHPDDVDVLTSLVDVYARLDDFETASGYLVQVINNEVLSLDLKIQLGQIFIQYIERYSEDYAETMKLAGPIFDAIIELYPDEPQPFFFRGIVALFSGDYQNAITHLIRVTDLDPENHDAWLYAGESYFQSERYHEAIELLHRGLGIHNDDFDLLFLIGLSYNRIDDLVRAGEFLDKAVTLKPDNLNALSMLALTYDSMDEYTQSDSLYEIALTLDSDYHLVLNNYSYSLAERNKDLDRALEMSKRAVEQQPENGAYLDTLGWIYFKMGEIELAKQYVRKAIDVGSESAVVHDHMGDIYYHLNEYELAMKYWKKALELDDSKEEIKHKIERGSI
jgi:tetratricopeptide (TPR) repeat protein